jgi:hypothetical protein
MRSHSVRVAQHVTTLGHNGITSYNEIPQRTGRTACYYIGASCFGKQGHRNTVKVGHIVREAWYLVAQSVNTYYNLLY